MTHEPLHPEEPAPWVLWLLVALQVGSLVLILGWVFGFIPWP